MKISQSLLFAFAAAQSGEDRWGSTDYYSFNYGFGDSGYGKQDSGIAFGMSDNSNVLTWTDATDNTGVGTAGNLETAYGWGSHSAHYADQLHYNGLLCWMCDFRLDLATEAETESVNAYTRCLTGGMLMRCRGEQRTCMFEERRRHGVVYSVCTGCKQTDACVAHWRRNQRFTLPFMNFGDMSLRNLPLETNNLLDASGRDQLPNHRPIYIDDECSTYQEVRTEEQWRAEYGVGDNGYNNEVYPMGWTPRLELDESTAGTVGTDGMPFTSYGGATPPNRSIADLQFTGHRVNLGLSYSKFAYDGATATGGVIRQLNAQLSQWESTCRWCCHARPDTVCNIQMEEINSSPFATKCGNAMGTKRSGDIAIAASGGASTQFTMAAHPLAAVTAALKTQIQDDTNVSNSQFAYFALLTSITTSVNGVNLTTNTTVGTTITDNRCSLSNSIWDTSVLTGAHLTTDNLSKVPQGINGKFRFFQPFNIAQSDADYYNGDASEYHIGPRFWMQMFQRTPQYDMSAYYADGSRFTPKFPSTGEGRNSAGADKYAGRGNNSRTVSENRLLMKDNKELQHFFQHQTDMVSQENRDFFDGRAKDAATAIAGATNTGMNIYLARHDNDDFWNFA